MAIGMSGCATWPAPADYRGSAARVGAEPRPLLAGPARLLHVNVDRRPPFTLYRIRTEPGKSADCGGARRDVVVDPSQGSILIGKDETICVATQGVSRSQTGVVVVDLDADEVVYRLNPELPLEPASTEKLVVRRRPVRALLMALTG